MDPSAMAELKAQFENAQRSAANSGNGVSQNPQAYLGNVAINGGNGNSVSFDASTVGGGGSGSIDRSNHVISSESSVASGNTTSAASSSHKLPLIKRERLSTGSSSEEKKDNDEDNDDGNSHGQGQGVASPANANSASSASNNVNANANANNNSADASGGASENKSPMVLQISAPPHPVAEFLFQLTKMLTDNNSEYIEWSNASIYVHDPPGLEKNILPKYFRHSNYSSFQRQMNYFGFRKIAGKGKMAPCSYVNEAAKEDISSLLFIKRKKTGVSGTAARFIQQQNRMNNAMNAAAGMGLGGGMPGGIVMPGGAMGMDMNSMHHAMGASGMPNPAVMGMGTMGGIGAMAGMGQFPQFGGLPGSMQGNPALALNNFQGMGAPAGMMGMNAGMMGAGGATAPNAKMTNLHESALLREQQQMLAQLQCAHQAASGPNPMAAPAAKGFSGAPTNAPLLTNDQGNVYAPGPSAAEWNNFTPSAATGVGFVHPNAAGGFQSAQGVPTSGDMIGQNRGESAVNLRALINQQISLYSSPSSCPTAPGAARVSAQRKDIYQISMSVHLPPWRHLLREPHKLRPPMASKDSRLVGPALKCFRVCPLFPTWTNLSKAKGMQHLLAPRGIRLVLAEPRDTLDKLQPSSRGRTQLGVPSRLGEARNASRDRDFYKYGIKEQWLAKDETMEMEKK